MTTYKLLFFVLLFVGGGALGWFMKNPGKAKPAVEVQAPAAERQHWTCPMHAEIDMPRPGKCPKCGMTLVQRKSHSGDTGPRTLSMSESDKKLAEIATVHVERKFVTGSIQLVGRIDYDETRVKTISAWVPGRLDRLFVDYTGVDIRKGDHLVEVYSPEFLTAQEELIEAKKQVDLAIQESSAFLRQSNSRALASARDKLRLWGLTSTQIAAIEKLGTVEDHVQINSPMTGIVIDKYLNVGDYVKIGTRIYQIADLTHLWVKLDAYESDLPHIHYGQKVSIQTESYPGRVFAGWISFIDPVLDQRTQTVKVRVNVDNTEGRLKPGMFARTRIISRPADTGGGISPRFKGKWICPMHPEVVEDKSGKCRVCSMDLVPAEKLGTILDYKSTEKPLVIPVTATLITGRRAVVYVRVPGKDRPTFEGRDVVLGPRAGDYYLVLSGLREGEEVVVNGNFKIDSALQILAKPSMLSMPADPGVMQGDEFLVFRKNLEPIYTAYFQIQRSLAKDDAKGTAAPYESLAATASDIPRESEFLPTDASKEAWIEIRKPLLEISERGRTTENLAEAREVFHSLSHEILELEKTFGHSQHEVHSEVFCPMAFDGKGAAWLQPEGLTTNPYLGTSMLRCGNKKRDFAFRGGPEGRSGAEPKKPGTTPPPDKNKKPAPAGAGEHPHDHGKMTETKSRAGGAKRLRAALSPLWKAYLQVQDALTDDALEPTRSAFAALTKAIPLPDAATLGAAARELWSVQRKSLHAAAERGAKAEDLATARMAFRDATTATLAIENEFGHRGTTTYYEMFCPMAFGGKGGSWLQSTAKVRNPYYGSSMIGCGSVKQQHKAQER